MSNTTSAKVGKTQAKQRYLKKKKDRRKAKKSAAAAATAAAKRVKSKSQIPEGDQATESQAEASSEDGDDSEHESGIAIKVDSVKEQKEPCPEPIQVDEETVEQRRHSPTPVAAFPSFPAPVAPDAPSKSELALQGVDKALINAEIIDPKHTLPLETFCTGSSADAQNLPVLSNKMRKRLLDLEIVELFAGTLDVWTCSLICMRHAHLKQSRQRCFPFYSRLKGARGVFTVRMTRLRMFASLHLPEVGRRWPTSSPLWR